MEDGVENALDELKQVIERSDSSHSAWSSNYFKNHQTYYSGISQYVDENLSEPLLEVGSAPYHLIAFLQKRGYNITGLDIDPERMGELIEALDLSIEQCDIERDRFPFDDNTFSGVIFTEVLEHLRVNPLHTLNEIRRVLRPDGKLLLSTPNLTSIYNLHSLLTEGKVTDPYEEFDKLRTIGHMGHVREYTLEEVRSLLEKTDFTVIRSDYVSWESKGRAERSFLHNLAVVLNRLVPPLRSLQIHIATPNMNQSFSK